MAQAGRSRAHRARQRRKLEKIQIARTYIIGLFQVLLHPLDEAVPMFAPKKNERKLGDALGLNEGEHFEKFIERAESAGHKDKTDAVFNEANFSGEKIMKV